MLSEQELRKKIENQAQLFGHYYRRKEYGKAHNIYNMAHTTAVMCEVGPELMKYFFGDWDSDQGDGTAKDDGLFRRWMVDEVNWKCCVERHQAYEDIACRRTGKPVQFYSDPDYCARCSEERKKRTEPNWWDGPTR